MLRNTRKLFSQYFWLLLFFRCDVALASPASLSEYDYFSDLPQVLSASRLDQPLADTPVAITIIDRELIEASGVLSIPHLLRLAPGFQVADLEGVDTVATYQGFSNENPRRMQVMVDGRSIYDPGINGVYWGALPLTIDQIDRIEVVRGANAATYGSNAFHGSVNIITRRAADDRGFKFRVLGGEQDTRLAQAQYSAQYQDVGYRLDLSDDSNNGYEDRFDSNHSQIASLRADYQPDDRDRVTFQTGYRETDMDTETYLLPRERTYRANYQHLVWNRTLSAQSDLRFQIYHNGLNVNDVFNGFYEDVATDAILDISLETHRYDAELQHTYDPGSNWRLSWGAGLRLDTAKSAGAFDHKGTIDRELYRLFTNGEWRVTPQALLNAGLMVEHFPDFGTYYSPRLALNWQAVKNHTIRIAVTRAYRLPTVLETNAEVKLVIPAPVPGTVIPLIVANPKGVDPEATDNFEVGYLLGLPRLKGNIDFRLFYNKTTGMIFEAEDKRVDPPVQVYYDTGKLTTQGLEIQADIKPTRRNRIHLAYSYTEANGKKLSSISATKRRYDDAKPAIPRNTFSLLAAQTFQHDWELSGVYYNVAGMEWLGEGNQVPTMSRLDVRLAKTFRLGGNRAQIALLGHNVLDQEYWEFQQDQHFSSGTVRNGNANHRRIYLELRAALH